MWNIFWHNPLPPSFSQCKQSRSGKNSTQWFTQKMGIDKERESEGFSYHRRRVSHSSWWFRVVYMFSESKKLLSYKYSFSFKLDSKKTLFQSSQKFFFPEFWRSHKSSVFQSSHKFCFSDDFTQILFFEVSKKIAQKIAQKQKNSFILILFF